MPDDMPPLGERRYEPRLVTEAGLEFIMGQIAKFPTRCELIHFRIWVPLGLCVLALIGLRMWTRWFGSAAFSDQWRALPASSWLSLVTLAFILGTRKVTDCGSLGEGHSRLPPFSPAAVNIASGTHLHPSPPAY
jgi:hypothetical protein